jgi:hypothetical protein
MKYRTPLTLLLVALALVCLCGTSEATIYVSKLGNNLGGGSWTTAFTTITAAIAALPPTGDTIWVQRGNYVEPPLVIPCLTSGAQVKLYGGFHGWETSSQRNFRNFITNPTVIDVNGAGTAVTFSWGCNVLDYVIDGFVIQNGYNRTGYGGGVSLVNAGATVANCTIVSNKAWNGGGVGMLGTFASIIENNKFSQDEAISGPIAGGGNGGAIYSAGGNRIIRNNWIGDALCVSDTSNYAEANGGGIYIQGGNPYVVYNVILRNQTGFAPGYGGGIYVDSCTNFCTIANNHVQGNTANLGGGGIWVGGGMLGGSPWLANNTVILNKLVDANGIGGGIGLSNVTTALVGNCIAAFNSNYQLHAVPPVPPGPDYNCVYEPTLTWLYFGVPPGLNDRQLDPLLDGPCDQATVMHLGAGSPCWNAGNNTYFLGPTDIDGEARIDPTWLTVDIGADEYYAPTILTAGATIQPSIDMAGPGDVVLVPFGVYFENLVMKSCVKLRGTGMPVIDGGGFNTVITVPPGVKCWIDGFEIKNGHAIQGGGINIGCHDTVEVTNCSIRQCIAEMDQSLFPSDPIGMGAGGGLYWAMLSAGRLEKCDVRSDFAQGPLINLNYKPLWLDQYAMGAGVAMESGASPTILTNWIENNMADWDGGGVWTCGGGTPWIERNHIDNNSATFGGGVYVRLSSAPYLCNNVICQNNASSRGGGLTLYGGGRGTYRSNTFAYNTAPLSNPTQVDVWGGSALDDFVNNIVVGVTPIAFGMLPYSFLLPPQRHNNCFWPDNYLPDIWANPMITNDCTVQLISCGSPCWNKGWTPKQCSTLDIDGNPRVFGADIDIGADELQASAGVEQPVAGPEKLDLQPAMPNPFTLGTMLRYGLPAASHVRLTVHDIQGRSIATVVDEVQAAGWHDAVWDGRLGDGGHAAAGIYFAHLAAGDQILKRTLVRIR